MPVFAGFLSSSRLFFFPEQSAGLLTDRQASAKEIAGHRTGSTTAPTVRRLPE